jgi:hypothetical protein
MIRTVFAMAAVLVAGQSFAAAANDTLSELNPVTVYGSRDIARLRQAVVEAEDRFYARYNELNDNDDYDVNCRMEARTGTRLERRICRAVYQEEAIRESSKEGLEIRQIFQSSGSRNGPNMPRSPPVPAGLRILAMQPDFQRNMTSVVSRSRVLTRLLKERAEAQAALDAAKRGEQVAAED